MIKLVFETERGSDDAICTLPREQRIARSCRATGASVTCARMSCSFSGALLRGRAMPERVEVNLAAPVFS